jgi:hypothetical protein
LLNRCAMANLEWRTPFEKALGQTPDLSALLLFSFYEPVYYLDEGASYPETKEKLGHFLGVAEHCGDELTFWILTSKRSVVARSVLWSVLLMSEHNKRQPLPDVRHEGSPETDIVLAADDVVDSKPMNEVVDKTGEAKAKEATSELKLELLSELVPVKNLPVVDPLEVQGYQFVCEEDNNGVPVRMVIKGFDKDTSLFKVLQGDDDENWVSKSVIQEALLSCKDDGTGNWVVKSIKDHRLEGNHYNVQVEWDDGNLMWEPLAVIRKDDPIKLALYSKEKGLIYHSGWRWARKMLKSNKRFARMLKLLKGQANAGPKYKFGIQVPRNVKEAIRLDKENGNTLWQDAMQAEIKQLLDFKTFQILPKGETTFPDMAKYQYVPLHFVFDVKFDLRRKAQCVAGGNWMEPPDSDVYSGVVSIENVRIVLFASVHNGLSICAADVGNVFLHRYTKELIYTRAGPKWGLLAGCILIIV